MRSTALLSAAALLFATASAAPHKREVVMEVVTEIDTVTELVTATVWVDPTDAPDAHQEYHSALAAPTTQAVAVGYYHHSHVHGSSSSSSSSSIQAPVQTTTPAPAPPAPTTSTQAPAPAPAPPTTTSVYVAPAPTSVYVPPPAPTTTTTPPPAAPTTTTQQAAAAPTSGGSSPSGSTYSGDITYYDVGLGSCGVTNSDSEFVVAMSAAMMNKATMCGKSITLSYGGITQTATVVDTCPGCASGGLDLSPALFKAIAPNGDGRVHNVQWWFN